MCTCFVVDSASTLQLGYTTQLGALAPEIGAACGRGTGRALLFLAEIDASARELVGRDFDDDPIADPCADAEFVVLPDYFAMISLSVARRRLLLPSGRNIVNVPLYASHPSHATRSP